MPLFKPSTALKAQLNSGYKDSDYAISEIIDNNPFVFPVVPKVRTDDDSNVSQIKTLRCMNAADFTGSVFACNPASLGCVPMILFSFDFNITNRGFFLSRPRPSKPGHNA